MIAIIRPDTLLRTKLAPPRTPKRALARPGLAARLGQALDHRLTILQASPGYGKTLALVTLFEELQAQQASAGRADLTLHWYTLDEADRDPRQFLAYLVAAYRLVVPALSDAPLAALEQLEAARPGAQWTRVIDTLANALVAAGAGRTLLALDDYQNVAGSPEVDRLLERFLTYAPPETHVIVATQQPPGFAVPPGWRARGEVLEIGRQHLVFSLEDTAALLREVFELALPACEVERLWDRTEGWPIALQLAAQGLRNGDAGDVNALLAEGSDSAGALFGYLAHELLDREPPEIVDFLLATSVLRELTAPGCAAVAGLPEQSCANLLARMEDSDLFVVSLGLGQHRYHHLFHEFLRARAAVDPDAVAARHRRAAAYFAARSDHEEAIYHWLAARSYDDAAAAIEAGAGAALRAGRLEVVAGWLDALPPEIVVRHPEVQALLGDVCRLRSRFDAALAWYTEAERTWRSRGDVAGINRAIYGRASVYLDTVNPTEAEKQLEEALRLIDGIADREAHARLLEMLAENKLNTGKPEETERLHRDAQALRERGPAEDMVGARVKLRTGQLTEARRLLEQRAQTEALGQVGLPRAHRETVLLLSLVDSFQGRAAEAAEHARLGVELGERLGSPFITAVGYMRQGHAWQLNGAVDSHRRQTEAIRSYERALALAEQLDVRRIRAEAMWGLTRAYGFFPAGRGSAAGDVASAARASAECREVGRWAGDVWMTALGALTLGASYVLAGQTDPALELLANALSAYRDCGDSFGRAAARLWQALAHWQGRQMRNLDASLEELLALCEANGYDYLLTDATLLGPPDPRSVVPLLLHARAQRIYPAYAARLLGALGLPALQTHPGYALRVEMLGAFRVWRGSVEVLPREWQRDKARQLFQLFLIERGHWIQREAIVDRLWPALGPEAGLRDFKVALNALNRALEPNHVSDDQFAYVVREGTAYRLRPEADLSVDADAFQAHAQAGLAGALDGPGADETLAHLTAAMRLYAGDFLPDSLYEDWAAEARERLLTLYLRAADRLAGALLDRGRAEEALDLCQAILGRDPCWERAYRLMMSAYAHLGNRPQALRSYQRCVEALRDELGVDPSPDTMRLHTTLLL